MNRSTSADEKQSQYDTMVQRVLGFKAHRVPALVVAFFIAEVFFKFGSFAFECIAFLVLWRALDALANYLVKNKAH